MVIGLGTLLNIGMILIGATLGVLVGNRLPERTNRIVTDVLGLVVLVLGGLNVIAITDPAFVSGVGGGVTLLVVLGALLIGSIVGSSIRIEDRLENFGGWLQRRVSGRTQSAHDGVLVETLALESRHKFVAGFVDASLVFCIGPLAILGAFSDGMGAGIEQLALKSTLDGFAALAFAATLGWGVAASAIPVGIWQGLLTVLAFFLGSVMSTAAIASLTATGGVLLIGVALRLLNIRQIAVGDMLPALIVAPLLTVAIMSFTAN
jgi:uncharacterized membrane protein YqgA involved in biofilm formation